MWKVMLAVRPQILRRAPVSLPGKVSCARAVTAVAAMLCCAQFASAAPMSRGGERDPRAEHESAIDFSALPSIVGTEYLRRGFDDTGHRAVFVLPSVRLTDLIRPVELDIEAPRTTTLVSEEPDISAVLIDRPGARTPDDELERLYETTFRATPPPGPSDTPITALGGAMPGREAETTGGSLNDYLTTPEPATAGLCVIGAALLMRRRK